MLRLWLCCGCGCVAVAVVLRLGCVAVVWCCDCAVAAEMWLFLAERFVTVASLYFHFLEKMLLML